MDLAVLSYIMNEIFMQRMSWKDVEYAVSQDYIVTLVVGATEQHGPHLPLGVDVFLPLGVAERVAEKVKMIIAPPLPYGYYSHPKSGGGETFPGTTSISSSTILHLIQEIVTAFLRHGFRRILVMNGHYENTPFLSEGVDKAISETERSDVRALIINYWDLLPPEVYESVWPEGFPGWDVEHAAVEETSIMMALKPDLVQMDKIVDDKAERTVPYDIIPPPPEMITETGVLWKATLASKEKGEIIVTAAVDKVVEVLKRDLM